MKDQQGLIFNIQRFSLHDGPGIRSTVFLKGCPLRCQWCSNPESWNPYPEIIVRDRKCVKSGSCAQACPLGAITLRDGEREIDRSKCDGCGKCAEACLHEAIALVGRQVTVDEVIAEVESDRLFYQHSGGGVTVSGGEPLLQWRFVHEVLKGCKNRGLHTALDTSGYCSYARLEKLLDFVDLVLFDVKHMDAGEHVRGTERSNSLILRNAERIGVRGKRLWLRFPFLPGYNDSEENIARTAEFGLRIGAERVSILPYHVWGKGKYGQLGRPYPFEGTDAPDDESVEKIKKSMEGFGLAVSIGR